MEQLEEGEQKRVSALLDAFLIRARCRRSR